MTPAPKSLGKRQQARREELVEQLLPIVEDLLDRPTSYLELPLEEIISRAGLGRSTFYRYFTDKNDLLLAISEPALDDILRAALGPWELGPTVTRAQLVKAMQTTVDSYRPHIALMNAMVEVSAYDARVKEKFLAGFGAAHAGIAERIAQGQADGYIRADVDADETAGWLTWMAERGMYQLVAHANNAKRDRLVDNFAGILWYAIYAGVDDT